jgi:uncharacterized membrane protein YeaQ/YmgE (transglycosylase-associated protein family)
VLGFLVFLVILGFVVGGLARLALPGPDPMPWYATLGLGLGGAWLGGIVGRILFGTGGGLLLAVLGGVLILALYRKYVQKRPVFRAR